MGTPAPRDVIQIHVDDVKDGKPLKRCPKCGILKDLDEFGLRRKVGAARNGADVISAQAHCRDCRSTRKRG